MKKLFSTPIDKLYSMATLIILIMIVFPPTLYGNLSFAEYQFIFDLRNSRLIDIGRLSLQFIALGIFVITIKRMIKI
jgi:hypothetical protein